MANEQRLIDANALIEKFRAHRDLFVSAWNEHKEMPPKDKARLDELGVCIAETINAPTVDAVPVVHGEWLFGELDFLGATVKCSNCGFGTENADPILWLGYPGHKFCGCCGARMDGGNEDG